MGSLQPLLPICGRALRQIMWFPGAVVRFAGVCCRSASLKEPWLPGWRGAVRTYSCKALIWTSVLFHSLARLLEMLGATHLRLMRRFSWSGMRYQLSLADDPLARDSQNDSQ
jgi:hypothetical protein